MALRDLPQELEFAGYDITINWHKKRQATATTKQEEA